MSNTDILGAFLCAAIVVCVGVAYLEGEVDCNDRGGRYVRTAVWYTCVEAVK